jgi:tRNA-2-methylthio-N6-dimethylallyladenosine synthase
MPSYSVITFGCQMNVHDSDRMHEVLRGAGYVEAADVESSDVVVLNTCSVREKAEQKLRSEVGRLALQKKKRGGDLVIAVAGCVAQQEGEKLLARMPDVDVILGPDNVGELPALLAQADGGGLPVVRTVFDVDSPRFLAADPARRGGSPVSTFVTIMKGCDERCSFCIVPHTRGPERYRASREIVAEIRALVAAGSAEITLLGQTVNSYRDPENALPRAPEAREDDPDESEFAALLRRIASEVPELSRLRYTSPHPRHLTPSLVAAHRDLEVLCAHVHLPVQSGSDRVLKRMIRRYTRAEYVERTGRLVAARPGMTLSTDVIVGFPGETDEEAESTVDLVREMGFTGVFGFKYSPRPYTPALKLGDDVSEVEKGRRLSRIFEASEHNLVTHLATLVGRTERVLIEGRSKTGPTVTGRTGRNEIVHVRGVESLDVVGRILDVVIGRANKHSLEGDPTEASLATIGSRPRERRALPLVLPLHHAGARRGDALGDAAVLRRDEHRVAVRRDAAYVVGAHGQRGARGPRRNEGFRPGADVARRALRAADEEEGAARGDGAVAARRDDVVIDAGHRLGRGVDGGEEADGPAAIVGVAHDERRGPLHEHVFDGGRRGADGERRRGENGRVAPTRRIDRVDGAGRARLYEREERAAREPERFHLAGAAREAAAVGERGHTHAEHDGRAGRLVRDAAEPERGRRGRDHVGEGVVAGRSEQGNGGAGRERAGGEGLEEAVGGAHGSSIRARGVDLPVGHAEAVQRAAGQACRRAGGDGAGAGIDRTDPAERALGADGVEARAGVHRRP